MQPPRLVNMFAVPFAFGRHPDHERLNPALRHRVLDLERGAAAANPNPLTTRNEAVFESHFDLFRDADAAIQELRTFCWDQLLAVVGQMNGYDAPTLRRLSIHNDCWFHVTRRGGFFGLHNHPNASWSGVYCVEPGRSDAGKPQSGVLNFVNPFIAGAMHQDAGVVNMKPPYGFQFAGFALEAGQLVLFPSWLLHDVKPYEGDGERITIAFNCWFSLPDA